MAALIRATFHIDPETLAPATFAKLANEAVWIRNLEIKSYKAAVKQAIAELFDK